MDGIELLKNCAAKPVPDELVAVLKDKHPDVRRAAADALAALKDEGTMPALIKLLDDPYYGVRYSAARALGQLRDGKAVPALIERMEKETHRLVYATIVRSLGDIGTPETARPLCRALNGPIYEARATAARALGKHKEPFVVDALIAALPDNDFGTLIKRRRANVSWPRMRIWAMRSLAQIGDQKAIEPIKAYLTDDDLSCRYPAALALLRLSGKRTDGVSRPRLVKMADEYIEQTTAKELLEFVPREYLRR